MIHELFRIGPFAVSPFGVMLMAAFLAAFFELRRGMRQRGIGTEEDASAILFAAGLGGIVGGKIYYAILYRDLHALFSRSGIVWYGGFLLATALIFWTLWRRRLNVPGTLDAGSLGLALGYGVGRIGCFLVGDDYGRPTDLPWGVEFPVGLPPTTAEELSRLGAEVPADLAPDALLAVHPTQLYETALALLIWIVGRRFFARSRRAGDTALLVNGLLALERFGIELLRLKDDRFLGPFTLAQAIALAVLAFCVALFLRRRPSPS
ncbi:MAG TPA: prolipoprotein diacylglyceryl transferase family protein [Thermoanaerobaculia bacterium]|nr:prolipoprotein diacylglyceryl transferase family protein [Thermoanaerobaculia bacterium]